MKLIKDYKSFIIEKYSMVFYSGLDEDKPGNNQVVTFDAQTQYEIEGETHGKLSHAIKHYDEFNPVEMNKILDDAIELIDNSKNKILKHIKTKNILNTEISRKSVMNTFDMINDKIIQNKQLNELEKQIKVLFLDKLENLYDELIEDYLENNKNVDDLSLSEIQKLVDASHKIRFSANFRGDYRNYILDPKTTGLLSSNNTGIFTLFRIDKSGNDLKKAALYLSKDIEIKNPDLKKFFSNLTSA